MMVDSLTSFLPALLWQSSALLAAAAILSILVRGRPAWAHLVLSTGFGATLVCAITSLAIFRAGGGLLPAHTSSHAPLMSDLTTVGAAAPPVAGVSTKPAVEAAQAAPDPPDSDRTPAVARPEVRVALMPVLLVLWIAAGLLLAIRAALRLHAEWLLVKYAPAVDDPDLERLAAEIARSFDVRPPELRMAPASVGPALWPGLRGPTVLLSPETLDSSVAEQRSIITHELAHWHRRDHLWHLLALVTVIVLPWQPFAWWCRRRLAAASEEACDAWVIALGCPPRPYAQLLLRLATQGGARLALSAGSPHNRTRRRVERLLGERLPHPRLAPARVALVMIVTTALILSVSLAQPRLQDAQRTGPDSQATRSDLVDQIQAAAIPLDEAGVSSLDRFGDLIGDARVVALGMVAPGSREMFEMRSRLLAHLVQEKGFTALVLATSFPDCLAIGDYVVGGGGDPEAALHAQGYWQYDNAQVLEALHWIRAWNQDQPSRAVHVFGMDMQQAGPALDVAADALAAIPEAEVDDLVARLAPLRDPFAIIDAYDDFTPAERDDLTENAQRLVSLFDQHRGALIESTSAWAWATARQHAVVVRQFEAWLRSHHAWAPPIGRRAFLSLWGRVQTEVPALIAFLETADPEYADTVDRRLQSLADDPYWSGREMAADRRAADLGRRLLARLDAHRQRYELQTSPEEWTAARAAAAMLVEFLAACAVLPEKTFQEPAIRRNEFMAENIEWILDEAAPGAKVVVWAHNDVIGRQPLALGEALAKRFGSDYRPLALTFGTGSIHAIHTPIKWDPPFAQHLDVHVLAGPSPEQIETLFLRAELDVFALDFRDSREDPALRAWLDQPRGMWTIGPGYAREREDRGEYATEVMLREQFDGLVFIASTTPVELNRRTRLRFKMAEPE